MSYLCRHEFMPVHPMHRLDSEVKVNIKQASSEDLRSMPDCEVRHGFFMPYGTIMLKSVKILDTKV